MTKRKRSKHRRKHRKNPRANPLGPLTGYPWTAGILAWTVTGAVGDVAVATLRKAEGEEKGASHLVGVVFSALRVIGAIAAYKAAKTP